MAACRPTGVSIAAVALANGLNANLLRRWIHEHTQAAVNSGLPNLSESPNSDFAPGFVPLVVSKRSASAGDIHIDLWRHDLKVSVTWPASASAECAAWLRELMQ